MFFYAGVILITTLISWFYCMVRKPWKRFYFFLLVLFPTIVAGLRGVGTDYIAHTHFYEKIINGSYFYADYTSLLIYFIRLLGSNGFSFQFSIFLISFLTVYLAFYIIRIYENEISLPFAVFSYMTLFYHLSFNLYRQILAVEFFLLAIVYLHIFNNKKMFWIYGFIAGFIHSSAFLFIFIFFVWKFITTSSFKNRRLLIYIIGTSIIIALPLLTQHLIFIQILFPHYENYFKEFFYNGFGFGSIKYIVVAIWPALFVRYLDRKIDLHMDKLSYCPFFAVFGTIIWLTSYVSSTYLYRMSYYLTISLPLFHGFIIKHYIERYGMKFHIRKGGIIAFMFIIVIIIFWVYDIQIANTGEILPYKFFWN